MGINRAVPGNLYGGELPGLDFRATFSGGACVISNQNSPWTWKKHISLYFYYSSRSWIWLLCSLVIPCATVYIYHTPLGRLSMVAISLGWNSVDAKKRSVVGNISPRELSEDVSFGVGTGTLLAVVEQSSSESRHRRVWYTRSYTVRVRFIP